jgi:tetratricopeptide (TPR) repeat protein
MGNRRDDFTEKVITVVLLRVGARCSNPKCRAPTHGPHSDPSRALNLGEASHITAAAAGGPRYDSALTPEERKSGANAIWLCRKCARQIDTDKESFPAELLRDWKREAEEFASHFTAEQLRAAGCLPAIWNVPHRRNPNFTGREELLAGLHRALNSGKAAAAVQVFHGQGGAGKTGLAVEYAYRHAADYNAICWLDAESPPALAGNYADLAGKLGLTVTETTDQADEIKAVRDWFEQNIRWLLVFDNALAPADLERFLPRGSTGHVLVTSRSPDWDTVAEPVHLPVWPRSDSISYLLRRTKKSDASAAGDLARELGDLPLALTQAAGYVVSKRRSLTAYLELFRTRRTDLWKREMPPEDYEETVATTWNLALQQLSAPAVNLLNLFACLGPESIPRWLIPENAACFAAPLAAVAADPLDYDDCLQSLMGYSLIEATEQAISVHRLLQTVVRDRLLDSEKRRWLECALRLINAAFSIDTDDPRPREKANSLVPHALVVLRQAEPEPIIPEVAGRLANDVAIYLKNSGNSSEARRLFRYAIEKNERICVPDHPALATNYSNLATVERELGNFEEARRLLLQAIAIDRKVYAAEHPTLATRYSNLALVEKDLGHLAEARQLLRQAITIEEKEYAADHPTLASAYSNLAMVEQDLGNLPEARRLLVQAIATAEKACAPDHPLLATTYSNLALVEHDLGNLSDARRLLLLAIAIDRTVYAADHPTLATRCSNLAMVEQDLGNLSDARQLLLQAIAIYEKAYAADHPLLATGYANLATVVRDLGDLPESRRLLSLAIAIDEKMHAADHPLLAKRYSNLAMIEHDLGNLPDAHRLMLQALAIDEKAYAGDHPVLATRYSNLAIVERDLGNFPEARRLMRQALAINEKAFGADHPNLATMYSNLAMVEQNLGNLPESRQLLQQAIAMIEKAYPADHPMLATGYSNLATAERLLGNLPEARRLLQQAVAVNETAFASDHPGLATGYLNLAAVERDLENFPEARRLMQQAIAIAEKAYPGDHPLLATAYSNLAVIEQDLGNPSEARRLMWEAHSIWSARLGDDHVSTRSAAEWLLQYDPENCRNNEGKPG